MNILTSKIRLAALRLLQGAQSDYRLESDIKVPKDIHGAQGKSLYEMAIDEFECQPFKEFRLKDNLQAIAMAEPYRQIIWLDTSFFEHSAEDRFDVIQHEKAHFIEAMIPPQYKASLFDNDKVMGYRGRNIDEKLANMIAEGKVPGEVFDDLPELKTVMSKNGFL